jgi:hypothetical protein
MCKTLTFYAFLNFIFTYFLHIAMYQREILQFDTRSKLDKNFIAPCNLRYIAIVIVHHAK